VAGVQIIDVKDIDPKNRKRLKRISYEKAKETKNLY